MESRIAMEKRLEQSSTWPRDSQALGRVVKMAGTLETLVVILLLYVTVASYSLPIAAQ